MFLKKFFCCNWRRKQKQENLVKEEKVAEEHLEEEKEVEIVKVEMDKKERMKIDEGTCDELPDPLAPYLELKKRGSELKEIYGGVDDFVYALFYLKA